MIRLHKTSLSLLCIWAAVLLAPAQQAAGLRPDTGGLNGRRYINEYFGFSYRFPEGWNGNVVNHSGAEATRFYSLFTAAPAIAPAGEVRYIGIQVDDITHNPSVRNGRDFLAVSIPQLTSESGAFDATNKAQREPYGGHEFYRQNLRSKYAPGVPSFYQTQLVAVERGYALTFSFIAASQDDLEEMVRSAESLDFFAPGSVPLPPQNPAATHIAQVPVAAPAQPVEIKASVTPIAQPAVEVVTVTVTPSSKSAPASSAPVSVTSFTKPPISPAPAPPPPQVATANVTPVSAYESYTPVATQSINLSNSTLPLPAPAPAAARPSQPVTGMAFVTPPSQPLNPPAKPAAQQSAPQSPRPAAAGAVTTAGAAPAPQNDNTTAGSRLEASSALMQPLYSNPQYASAPIVRSQNVSQPQSEGQPPPESKPAPAKASPQANLVVAAPRSPAPKPVQIAEAVPPVSVPRGSIPTPAQQRLKISTATLQSFISRKTPVVYPEMARAQRVEGAVVLKVVVDRDGKPKEVTVVSGPLILRQGAISAVKEWRFTPYQVEGQAVEFESEITMNFRLSQ